MKCILSTEPERRYKANDIRQHIWFTQYNKGAVIPKGDKPDENIPIYIEILNMLEEFRFDKKEAEKMLKANKHNHITTTYYLLLKKYERKGKKPLTIKNDHYRDTVVEGEADTNQTQPPLYPDNFGVTQKVKGEYLAKSQLNQTLPVSTRERESLVNQQKKSNYDSVRRRETSENKSNISKHHIYMETSRAEQQAGFNVSYDNSFNAIKGAITKTVGGKPVVTDKNEDVNFRSIDKAKPLTDDLPPNKPNEAIKISETIKISDGKTKVNNFMDDKDLNNTMPVVSARDHSIGDHKLYEKEEIYNAKGNNTIVEEDRFGKTSLNFNTVREQKQKAGSSSSHYHSKQNKSSTRDNDRKPGYKKGHMTNLSSSNKPDSTHYMSDLKSGVGSTKKDQMSNFMTQSMDNSTAVKDRSDRIKKSIDKHGSSQGTQPSKKYAHKSKDEGISSGRPARYARASKNQARANVGQQRSIAKDSDVLDTEESVTAGRSEMKIYKGPFAVSCSTTKEPSTVMADMIKSLGHNSVSFQRVGMYFIRCQKSSTKFEMELTKMENLDFVYIVRMLRTSGDISKYREISGRILNAMKL